MNISTEIMPESYSKEFSSLLMKELLKNRKNDYKDNKSVDMDEYNTIRYEAENLDHSILVVGKKTVLLNPLNLIKVAIFNIYPQYYYKQYVDKFSDIGLLYELLSDQKSKELLLALIAFRIFGYKRVKLLRNNTLYWKALEDIQTCMKEDDSIEVKFGHTLALLKSFNLEKYGFDLKVYGTGPGLCCAFVQKQYEFHNEKTHIKVEKGDYVIDAGACWGDTTMYFAHEVGEKGKVFAFEFIPSNLEATKQNINCNPQLKHRVKLIENPIWSISNNKLYYVDWGPGSRVTPDKEKYQYQGTCETLSIDDFVAQNKIDKIDFIKMDIEGAELDALKGAENTLKKFRPKLAISLYHSIDDFTSIPKYLSALNLGYNFYLDHHTIYQNETVLFAN